MKTCTKCKQSKPLEEFNKRTKSPDGRHAYCKECHKQHYRDNIDRHKENTKKNRELYKDKARVLIRDALKDGCVDCHNKDIRVLDFDHVRGTKITSVLEMVRNGWAIQSVIDEMAKCEVRCKNCHAIATYARLDYCWRNI